MGLLLPKFLVETQGEAPGALVTSGNRLLRGLSISTLQTSKTKGNKMNIVDTPSTNDTAVARTADGKLDLNAYLNCQGTIDQEGLTVNVIVLGARRRYGHLDLEVTPVLGTGRRWVERKNIVLNNDPAGCD
jgi:hypothetical protein